MRRAFEACRPSGYWANENRRYQASTRIGFATMGGAGDSNFMAQSTLDRQSELTSVHQGDDFPSVVGPQARLRLLLATRSLAIVAERLFLVVVLATGAFLRLWQINALGYNSDEAVYAGQGAAIAADPTLKEIFPVF